MFHTSTQKSHWLFRDEDELMQLRTRANQSFCEENKPGSSPLDPSEELQLLRYYQKKLVELCNVYAPPKWLPLPRTALATAVTYFKRFYLYTSVMEYHPQDIYLCCAFLAFKIDEYNVTLEQFIETLSPFFPEQQLRRIADFILSHELFLLQKLKFHLTVHSPFRPLSGFLVDMKTRSHHLPDPEQFKKIAEKFLLLSLHSDVCLLFPPSQIALAALCHSARQLQTHIEDYITSILLNSEPSSTVDQLMSNISRIDEMVMATTLPDRASVAAADEKLSHFIASSNKSRKRKSEESPHQSSKKHKQYEDTSISGIEQLH